jgi:hypothetical protein
MTDLANEVEDEDIHPVEDEEEFNIAMQKREKRTGKKKKYKKVHHYHGNHEDIENNLSFLLGLDQWGSDERDDGKKKKKVNDEGSDSSDANIEVNVTPEPAVMKHSLKLQKRVRQKEGEDPSKNLIAKRMLMFQNVFFMMKIPFDLKKYKEDKEYRSAMIK